MPSANRSRLFHAIVLMGCALAPPLGGCDAAQTTAKANADGAPGMTGDGEGLTHDHDHGAVHSDHGDHADHSTTSDASSHLEDGGSPASSDDAAALTATDAGHAKDGGLSKDAGALKDADSPDHPDAGPDEDAGSDAGWPPTK